MAMASMSSSIDQPPTSMYNTRSTSVKRLMREAQEMRNPTELYFCQPVEDNLFEWHFTIRGPISTEFEQGIYHGRIIFPAEYPMKPPSIILLTESGRFKTNEKICLSISGHHAETWTPTWGVRTALLAIIGFMETPGEGALGSLDYGPEERRILAKRSTSYVCPKCGVSNSQLLLPLTADSADAQKEAKELGNQINFVKKAEPTPTTTDKPQEEPLIPNEAAEQVEAVTTTADISQPVETRPTHVPHPVQLDRDASNHNLLSMLLFICCLILSFLLLRRLFLTFGANRSFPPPSSDPFHDDF